MFHSTGARIRIKEVVRDINCFIWFMGFSVQAGKILPVVFLSKPVSIFAFGDMKIENSSGFGFSCRCLASQRTQPLFFRHLTSGINFYGLGLEITFQLQWVFCKVIFCGQGRSNSYVLEINRLNSYLKIEGWIKNCNHNANINLR